MRGGDDHGTRIRRVLYIKIVAYNAILNIPICIYICIFIFIYIFIYVVIFTLVHVRVVMADARCVTPSTAFAPRGCRCG